MTDTFKRGDIVILKSNGPDMTVVSVEQDGETQLVHCAWFTQTKKRETGTFPSDALIHAAR